MINSIASSAVIMPPCPIIGTLWCFTKLSPNQTDIAFSAQRCIDAGTDGLAVINTLMGMAIDIKTKKPIIGNNQGGLSGPAIKPIALLKVHQVYQVSKHHNVPIIGQGGIMTAGEFTN
jgi:dihydroorotate dehydrogenase (NAD+) catalytic subunit